MKLNHEDKQKVLDWLKNKCGDMRCICCGNGRWSLLDFATLPIGLDLHTTRFYYHSGIPQIAIVCENCAHIIYFNAVMMGFKPDEPAEVKLS